MEAHTGLHWLNFSLPINPNPNELDNICQRLFDIPLSRFNRTRVRRNGYREQWTLNPLDKLITIYNGNDLDRRINCYFELSGMALDTLPLDICDIGQYVLDNGGNITQLHPYADSTDGKISFETLRNYSSKKYYKDRVKGPTRKVPKYVEAESTSITYGSPKSDRYLIAYDKGTFEDTDFPWLRFELHMSNRSDCRQFIQAIAATGDKRTRFVYFNGPT